MHRVIFLIFLITGCGELPDYECSYYINTVCVSVQPEYPIEYSELANSILELELETSEYMGRNFQVSEIPNYTMLIYLNPSDWRFSDYRGTTIDNRSFVRYGDKEDDAFVKCIKRNYVAMHELMHQIAKYNLEISDQDNRNHDVEGFFLESLGDDSAEFQMYYHIWFNVCSTYERPT